MKARLLRSASFCAFPLALSLSISLPVSLFAAPAHAAQPVAAETRDLAPLQVTTIKQAPLTLEVVDYSARFLAWHAAASKAPDASARWALWQEMYGQAAVPPTPQGTEMARRLVENAWPRYATILPTLRGEAESVAHQAAQSLARVAVALGLEKDARLRLVTIVSGFENNAYAYRADMPVLVIPLEASAEGLPMRLAHEGTHAVHMLISGVSGQWERSVAATILQEGLAMHTACEVLKGRAVHECVGGGQMAWERAMANRRKMLESVRADLDRADSATVAKYTLGMGNTGQRREAYALGWWVIERMRADGETLPQLARIKESDMPARVARAIESLLKNDAP